MMTDHLDPEALEAATKARAEASEGAEWCDLGPNLRQLYREEAKSLVSAYLTAAQPRTVETVEQFINDRPEYITALQNTRGTDDQADYHRWKGNAEARRQLAQALGWAVPHNPGETTRPTEGGKDA